MTGQINEPAEPTPLTLNATHQQILDLSFKFCEAADAGDYDYNVAFGAGCMYLATMIRAYFETHNIAYTKENVEGYVNKLYVQLGESVTFILKMRDIQAEESAEQPTT